MSDDKPISYPTLASMPEIVISEASMRWNKTGTWRYLAPRYLDRTPPCNQRCPAGNDVEGFIRLLEKGTPGEALRLIRDENPFPGVCGRVCYHPCEIVCNRSHFDDPVAIHSLERRAADAMDPSDRPLPIKPESGNTVAIVGSGPAGLTAAYHLARMGHQTLVYEALSEPGGLLRYGIPAYRLPREVLNAEIDWIKAHGVEIICNSRIGVDTSWYDLESSDAVFISTGVHRNRHLGIPGEGTDGVLPGLGFLKEVATGNPPEISDQTIIIGGGNTAIDSARCALRLGSQVTIFYHRSRKEMPAFEEEVNEAIKEGVRIRFLTQPAAILTENGRVTGMTLRATRLGDPDASGRRRPEPVPDSEFDVEAGTIITAIGESAELEWLPDMIDIESGQIGIDETGGTGIEKVFAGGDVALSEHNVTVAIGSGKTAACAIDAYLRNIDFAAIRSRTIIGETGMVSVSRYLEIGEAHSRQGGPGPVIAYENLNTNYFRKAAREKVRILDIQKRVDRFDEVNRGLDSEAAISEAKRCFHCGVCTCCDNCYIFCPDIAIQKAPDGEGYRIDMDYCKGCGICVNECPRAAMVMEEEG